MDEGKNQMKPLDRYLSRLDVWGMAFGCIVSWGVLAMPGTTFLPVAGPVGTLIAMVIGMAIIFFGLAVMLYVQNVVRKKHDALEREKIRVADTGIGMSREFVERIFDSFERERNSTVSGIEGTGLGMSITKSIVDLMGGTIEVLTAPGSGTQIIRLKLKLAGESEDPRPGGQRAGGYPDRRHDRKRLFRGRQSRGAGRYTGAYRKACGYRGADEYAQVRPAAQVSVRTK